MTDFQLLKDVGETVKNLTHIPLSVSIANCNLYPSPASKVTKAPYLMPGLFAIVLLVSATAYTPPSVALLKSPLIVLPLHK